MPGFSSSLWICFVSVDGKFTPHVLNLTFSSVLLGHGDFPLQANFSNKLSCPKIAPLDLTLAGYCSIGLVSMLGVSIIQKWGDSNDEPITTEQYPIT